MQSESAPADWTKRELAIIWLLEHRNDHLPTPIRHVAGTAGFINEPRDRSCPDCLANGRTMIGCETCGGSGVVTPPRLRLVASPDQHDDDGQDRDPYAKNHQVGFDLTRHDAARERDQQIDRLQHQTRPPRSEAQLLHEANTRGYAWEEARRTMYRRYDFAALDRALDSLRSNHPDSAHALNAVYIDGWLTQIGEITPLVEQHCAHGIWYLDLVLPHPLLAGTTIHRADARQASRRDPSDHVATMTAPASAEAPPAMGTGSMAAACDNPADAA